MALRCVYTDLDGTLLGKYGSLFRDAEGNFSMLQARAIEACHRAEVEVVIKSGRREAQVLEDARLIGSTAYIYEVGCAVVIDGEKTILVGDAETDEGKTVSRRRWWTAASPTSSSSISTGGSSGTTRGTSSASSRCSSGGRSTSTRRTG